MQLGQKIKILPDRTAFLPILADKKEAKMKHATVIANVNIMTIGSTANWISRQKKRIFAIARS